MSHVSERTQTAECQVVGAMEPGFDEILTPDALAFIAELSRRYSPNIADLLAKRLHPGGQLPGIEPSLPRFVIRQSLF